MKFIYALGATPFNQDDADNLIPKHITTQIHLNEWEQYNILKAEKWLFSRDRKNILTSEFLRKLHFKMFDKTWRWAGQYRQHQTNIGCAYYDVSIRLHQLCDDVQFWVNHQTFIPEHIAIQFHHRLVQIHAFSNGNGRHARLASDALLAHLKCSRLSWGRLSLVEPSQTRTDYIKALQLADQGNYEALYCFASS